MRSRITAILVITGLVAGYGSAPALGQGQTNHAAATLLVNENAAGPVPLTAIMGRLDSNTISIDGNPGAQFILWLGALGSPLNLAGVGTVHLDPYAIVVASGNLDADGHHGIFFDSGDLGLLPAGLTFGLQALVADPSMPSGYRLTAATEVSMVHSWAGAQTTSAAVGSTSRMEGPVWSLSANTVAMGNVTFHVDANTEYENINMLSDLVIGDWAIVEGFKNSAGGLTADHVELGTAESEARLRGFVLGVGPSGFSVLGVSVYTTTGSAFDDNGQASSLSNLTAGTMAEVRVPVGVMFPDATSVKMNLAIENEPEPEPEPEPDPEDPPPPYFWVF